MSAMDTQIGGDHYKNMAIQPSTYCERNRLTHLQSQTVKYVSRWNDSYGEITEGKWGLTDLKKAIHCLEMMIDMYYDQEKEDSRKQPSSEAREEVQQVRYTPRSEKGL
jgi:hypothetical protein